MSEQQQPVFGIEKIYLKDMSLEIPSAPQIFFEQEAPEIDVNIHNQAQSFEQEGLFEVVLTVTVTAKLKEKTAYLVEAAQAGIFHIRNLSPENVEAVLGIMCPNALLPYARETIASTIARAGFPPVVLQHMNFEAIYHQRLQQKQQEAAAAAPPAPH